MTNSQEADIFQFTNANQLVSSHGQPVASQDLYGYKQSMYICT